MRTLAAILLLASLLPLACQQSATKSADKPTLKKKLSEVWAVYVPQSGMKATKVMTDLFDIPLGGLEIPLDHPFRIISLEFVFESDDRYRFELRRNDTLIYSDLVTALYSPGPDELWPSSLVIPDSVQRKYIDNIRIVPDGGDGHYRVGHVSFVSND